MGPPVSLADWDWRGKLFSPLMQEWCSSSGAIREVIWVAQIALHGLALCRLHPSSCLVDLLHVLLEVRSGYKLLITFWKPILDILFPFKALAEISAQRLPVPSGAGTHSKHARFAGHRLSAQGRGRLRWDGAIQYLSDPSRVPSDNQQTKQKAKPNSGSQLPSVKLTDYNYICGRI